MKYYLYRHIRLDKNEPFYIGIGTKCKLFHSFKYEFRRAFSTKRRGKIWNDITNKTEYEVEILMESDDYNLIKNKEKEFIKLYGRKDLGTGILANLTDGGEGKLNYKYPKDLIHPNSVTIYQYNLEGEFIKDYPSINNASHILNIKDKNIRDCLYKKSVSSGNYRWFYTFKGVKIEPVVVGLSKPCTINMLDTSSLKIIKQFSCIKEAAIYFGNINKTSGITKACSGINKSAYGYKWEFGLNKISKRNITTK